MSEDKELTEINNKKLKAKGAKVVEEQKAVSYEAIVMQMSQYLNDRGLEMMNVSTDLRKIIADDRQKKSSAINVPDNEKQ